MQSGIETNDPLKSGPAKAGSLTGVATTALLYNTTMFLLTLHILLPCM